MRLIIIDDHKMFLNGIEKLFETNRTIQIVETFSNSTMVLPYLNGNLNKVDGILTDLNMLNLNGLDLIKKIKIKYPNFITIAFSMYSSQKMIEELKKNGCDGFIHKSYSYTDLVNAIEFIEDGHQYFSPRLATSLKNYDFSYNQNNKIRDSFAKRFYLSKREIEVLELIVQNYSSKKIAEKLFVSFETISSHRKNLIKKTECRTAIDFYLLAIEMGLIKIHSSWSSV
jgi:DNA-binding NarL/FixJ family response regulator